MQEGEKLEVKIYRGQTLFHASELGTRISVGRQRPGEPEPPHYDPQASRLVVAPLNEKLVSREHLQLTRPISDAQTTPGAHPPGAAVVVKNLSRKRSVWVDGHGRLAPQESMTRLAPLVVTFEDFSVHVAGSAVSGDWELRSLSHPTMAPRVGSNALRTTGTHLTQVAHNSLIGSGEDSSHTTEQLIHWLGEAMEVLQSAAGASDYLLQAVESVHRIVGLDAILALRYDGDDWQPFYALDAHGKELQLQPSRSVLQQVIEQKRTVRRLPAQTVPTQSLQGVSALVAAPILNPGGDVIGALYGVRQHQTLELPQITELEATMVEVIACGAAAGIAREKEQEKAIAARVQFEQFFTPQLARELERNPELLEPQLADISVLFCDIVGFSSISGRIGSNLTMQWIGAVMDRLSEAVLAHKGVLVDYIGDELMAMWGAPKAQADHCQLASNAGQELLECLAEVDQLWESRIGEKTQVRIGIASGDASVGNTGSARKFKYGPLGETVNLASRLQGAGKQLGVQTLVSKKTALASKENSQLVFRQLGSVRLVNMLRPVEVFEIMDRQQVNAAELAGCFADIVSSLDLGDAQLEKRIQVARERFPDDVPTKMLANRVAGGESLTSECLWHFDVK